MKRTYKYKTIEALLKANIKRLDLGINLELLTSGRLYSDKKNRHINFELPTKECERVAKMFVKCLGFRGENKVKVAGQIAYCIKTHNIISTTTRAYISLYKGEVVRIIALGKITFMRQELFARSWQIPSIIGKAVCENFKVEI